MSSSKIDFGNDLKDAFHSAFKAFGVRIPKNRPLNEVLFDYLTVRKKFIDPIPRKVLISPILKSRLQDHSKKREIEYLIQSILIGRNINQFQSEKILQSKSHDHLLYEWNIRHFHLSLVRQKNSIFMKRTKELIFVYIENETNTTVFLDTDFHSKEVFADSKWFEILHDHFPQMIQKYELKDQTEFSPNLTSEQRRKYRDFGYTVGMITVKDKIYQYPGIGITTSGHSVTVIKTSNEVLRWYFIVDEQFEKYYSDICTLLKIPENKSKFKMRLGPNTIEVYEKYSDKVILEFPNSFEVSEKE